MIPPDKKKKSPFGDFQTTQICLKTPFLGNKNSRQTTPRVLRDSSRKRGADRQGRSARDFVPNGSLKMKEYWMYFKIFKLISWGKRSTVRCRRSGHRFRKVCIPTPDAMLYISSQLAPMKCTASMSVYGGLVPLGFTHSN